MQRQYNNKDTVIKSYRIKAFILETLTQYKIHMQYVQNHNIRLLNFLR